MDPPHQRPLGIHQGLHFEGQVVEELGKPLPVGLLVVAEVGVQADAFHHKNVQPRAQPEAQAQAHGALPKVLGGHGAIGNRLVEGTALLRPGDVAHQVHVGFQRERSAVEQSALNVDTGEVLGPPAALEQEGFAEVGIHHLAGPHRGGPGVGMPVGQLRNLWGAGHRRRGAEGLRRRLLDVEILGAGVEVEHPVHVFHLAHPFQQAVAEFAGLQILLAPLETHGANGIHRA